MAKNLNVNLTFTANTQQAKMQLQQLQVQLNSLVSNSSLGLNLTKDIREGISAASQLKNMLQSATNVDTGKLNLSQFNQQLIQSGMTLGQFGSKMSALGTTGQQAFQNITRAVASAEVPLRATNTMLDKMWVTMSNTMRWQISASVLQGFMSTIQGAYSYAQDLNESLNNIRIVTGQNAEQMDRFAEKANKAAKALNTSTTAYTDAALIYYQQGLSDKQVEERTNVTVKLANVVGENAQTVSEWMTSIWNNFDNGSKSLEYYADVLTALGAATASSSDEIAGGLEKFAAIAETVGLSYEYAATALATITAETRQSEDVVGTALKTIFARIQDLELGKTLDDGTSLGQYSEALSKIGVEVLDTSGNLREMDKVLNDMGSKWKTLSEAQKVATAQSVAGIRQYSQLIALMDNWDTFQLNLDVATNAEGTLQEQADIFAESWEAASQRVKAAAEDLYDDLLKDDFFIGLTDSFGYLLNGIGEVIDAMGGLKGLLPLLIAGFTKLFGEKMLVSIKNFSNSMKLSSARAQQMALSTKQEALNLMQAYAGDSHAGSLEVKELELQKKIYDINRMLTDEEQKQVQLWFDQLSTIRSVVAELEKMSQAGKQQQNQFDDAVAQAGPLSLQGQPIYGISATRRTENQARVTKNAEMAMLEAARFDADMVADSKEDLRNKVLDSKHDFAGKSDIQNQASLATADADDKLFEFNEDTQKWKMKNNALDKEATIQTQKLSKAYSGYNKKIDNFDELLNDKIAGMQKDAKATAGAEKATDLYNEELNNVDKNIKQMSKTPLSNTIMATAQSVSSLTMGLSSAITVFETIGEAIKTEEFAFSDFLSILMSLGMSIPMVMAGFTGLKGAMAGTTIATVASAIATKTKVDALDAELAASGLLQAAITKENLAKILGITTDQAAALIKAKKAGMTWAEAAAEIGLTTATTTGTAATIAQTIANWALQASMSPVLLITLLLMAAMLALVAVVAAVVAIIGAASDAYNKDAIAAKEAAAQAEETANAYKKVKEELEALKTALEDYNAAQNAILILTEGTDEWREAIQESNASILELLNTYPELAKYIDNVEGRLVITDENQLKMLDEMTEKATLLNNINQSAQLTADKAQQKADVTSTVRAIDEADVDEDNIRKGIGIIEEAYTKIGNAIFEQDEYEAKIEELKSIDEDLVDVFKENKEAIEELIKAEQDLVIKEDLVKQQKIDNLLYDQDNFIASHYGKNVQQQALKLYNEAYDEAQANTDNWHHQKWYSLGIATGGTDEGEDAFRDYAELMGYKDADATDFKGDRIIFEYTNDDGEVEEKEVKYEAMQQALTEKAMTKKAADIADKVNQMSSTIIELNQSESEANQALASFLENGDLNYLDPQLAQSLSSSDLTDEQAKQFGYNTAQEVIDAFNSQLSNYDPAQARSNLLAKKAQEVNATLTAGAEELEISKSALEMYAQSLVESSSALEGEEEQAAKLAVTHYRLAKGINNLQDTFKKYSKVLKEGSKNSLDYYEALGAVKEQVEATFGLKVSGEFIESNLETIESLANGDDESLTKLQKALVSDYVLHLNIDESYKIALNNTLQDLMVQAENADINTKLTLDNTDAINAINTALRTGEATITDIESMFNNANLQMPEYKIAKIPHVSTTKTNTTSKINILGKDFEVKSEGTTATTTYSDVPYFGENAPTFDENGNMTDAGGGGSLSVKTSGGNLNLSQDLIDYEGDGEITETSSEKKQRLKELDNEIERYHEIDEVIQDLERNSNRLAEAKERAFGANKLDLMDQEIAKEKELLSASEERLRQAKDWYKEDRENLLNNYAVNLDAEGRITNYNDLIQTQVNKLKNINDPESEEYKIQKNYLEQMKEDFSQYEETLDTVNEEQKNIIDKQNELADLALEKIEYKVQIKVDIAEDDAAYIDFLMQKIEDDAFSAAEAIGLLGQQAETIKSKIEAAEQGIADIMADIDKQGFMTEAQAEDLREYRDDLIDANTELLEIRNTVQEKLTEAYDAWNEKLDKNATKIEHLTSVTDSYKNIIDIVGKDTLGISDEAMAKLTDIQVNNANNALKASKAKLEANEAFLKDLQQKRADAVAKYGEDSDEVADWDKQIEYAEEQVMSAKEDFMGNWENALTAAADAFASHVDTIVENFSEAMSGAYKNLEQLQEAFGKQVEVNDRYLQQYEKTYEINKLNRSIQDSIDKTDNVASQKELRKLQKELLAMQEDGVNVSQRDIEYMQKKYDLMVAEQALKDAQNAKSVVRLTRDSEGNFGYTYTADQGNVDNAQQNYEDKLYAMQQFGDESLQEIQEQILATNTEFKEALQAIADDSTLSLEEKKTKAEEITEYYTGKLNYWTGEAQKFMQHGQEMNSQYNADMAENFHETLLGSMYPVLTSFQGYYKQGMSAMTEAGDAFTEALEGYQGRIDTAFNLAGENVQTFAEDVAGKGGYLNQVQEESNKTAEETESLKDDMIEALGEATSSVEDFYGNYANYMSQVRQETDDTIQKVNELIKKYNELANTDKGNNSGAGSGEDLSGFGSGTGSGSNSGYPTTLVGGIDEGTLADNFKIATKVEDKQLINRRGYVKINGSWYTGNASIEDYNYNTLKAGDEVTLTNNAGEYRMSNEQFEKVKKIKDKIGQSAEIAHNGKGSELGIPFYTDLDKGFHNKYTYKAPTGNYGNVIVRDVAWHNGYVYVQVEDDGSNNCGFKNDANKTWMPVRYLDFNNNNKRDYSSYDTGGYTGEWGPEGRMAMLHQKEIVLNAHDTENFLAAIGIVRDISDQIEKNAIVMQYQNQLANYRASVGNSDKTLQQEVHITAEFPNATDHNEIEEAFKNLTNLASQYANRK